MHRFKFEKLSRPLQIEPSNVELKSIYATKNPYIDPQLNKHKRKIWLHNFNAKI